MKRKFTISALIIFSAIVISACANEPKVEKDPYNKADSQRNRAGQTQGELSSETARPRNNRY